MHHDIDLRIRDQCGDGGEGCTFDRVDQVDASVDRDLGEAGHRRVRTLPQKLEVERDPAVFMGGGHDGGHAARVPDDL